MKKSCHAALFTLLSAALLAQPNPYRTVENFFKLPDGREIVVGGQRYERHSGEQGFPE